MSDVAGKRLMVLGGSDAQLVLIRRAMALGAEVIVADRDPDCAGGRLAQAFHAVSTADIARLAALAQSHAIDGIATFASDPSALAVAEVARQLRLPGNPVAAVETLINKDRFRAFLAKQGFLTPRALPARDRRLGDGGCPPARWRHPGQAGRFLRQPRHHASCGRAPR